MRLTAFLLFTFILIYNFSLQAYEGRLAEPLYDQKYITQWSKNALEEVLSFSYTDHEKELEKNTAFFTAFGEEKFLEALNNARMIETVVKNKMFLSAEINGDIIITKEGVNTPLEAQKNYDNMALEVLRQLETIPPRKPDTDKKVYFWNVEAPVRLSYDNGSRVRTDDLKITLVIERTNELDNPSGIGITQLIAIPAE